MVCGRALCIGITGLESCKSSVTKEILLTPIVISNFAEQWDPMATSQVQGPASQH